MTMEPELEWIDVDLVPRGIRRAGLPEFAGALRIGRIVPQDALALLRREGRSVRGEAAVLAERHGFALLSIPLSLRRLPGAELSLLVVEVALEGAEEAISWAMEPMHVTEPRQLSMLPNVGDRLDLDSSPAGDRQRIRWEPDVEAFDLRQSRSCWEIRPTAGHPLVGVRMLHMIAVVPNADCVCRVGLSADLIIDGRQFPFTSRGEDGGAVQTVALAEIRAWSGSAGIQAELSGSATETPHEELRKFLGERFSWEELRALLRGLPDGRDIDVALPERPESRNHLIDEVVLVLGRRGCLDAVFFAALVRARPRFQEQIREMARRWGIMLSAGS